MGQASARVMIDVVHGASMSSAGCPELPSKRNSDAKSFEVNNFNMMLSLVVVETDD